MEWRCEGFAGGWGRAATGISTASRLISFQLPDASTYGYLPRGAENDAKDARVIADIARMRRDLTVITADDELVVELPGVAC